MALPADTPASASGPVRPPPPGAQQHLLSAALVLFSSCTNHFASTAHGLSHQCRSRSLTTNHASSEPIHTSTRVCFHVFQVPDAAPGPLGRPSATSHYVCTPTPLFATACEAASALPPCTGLPGHARGPRANHCTSATEMLAQALLLLRVAAACCRFAKAAMGRSNSPITGLQPVGGTCAQCWCR